MVSVVVGGPHGELVEGRELTRSRSVSKEAILSCVIWSLRTKSWMSPWMYFPKFLAILDSGAKRVDAASKPNCQRRASTNAPLLLHSLINNLHCK